MFTMIRLVATQWRGDMQEIESINSVLQKVAARAPNISLALLDARVAVRTALGMGFAAQSKKWSQVEKHVLRAVSDACEHTDQINTVLSDPTRWSRPEGAAPMHLPAQARLDDSEAALHSKQALWRGQHNSRAFMRSWNTASASADKPNLGVMALIREGSPEAWICCMKYARSGHLLKCTVLGGDGVPVLGGSQVEIVRPIQVKSSLFVFAALFEEYVDRGVLPCSLCELDLDLKVSTPLAHLALEAAPPQPLPARQLDHHSEDTTGCEQQQEYMTTFETFEASLEEAMGVTDTSHDDGHDLAEDVDGDQSVRQDINRSQAAALITGSAGSVDFCARAQRALEALYPNTEDVGQFNGDEDAHIAAEMMEDTRITYARSSVTAVCSNVHAKHATLIPLTS